VTQPCAKARYGTKRKAHEHMRKIMLRGKAMRCYECKRCGGYHLTSDTHGKGR
jgi:hypothetical protein